MSYIRKPDPSGFYSRPRELENVDVFVEDDHTENVRYICLTVADWDKLHGGPKPHDQQLMLVRQTGGSPGRLHLLHRDDPQGTGNHYIDPKILVDLEFQIHRFVFHLLLIPPFPESSSSQQPDWLASISIDEEVSE